MTTTTITERRALVAPATARSRLHRIALGDHADPTWARPGLWALLLATAGLYLWSLTASGYANEFYAAAVKSATMDPKAWLFASLDAQNAITVDKPPAAIWVMGLSARVLGFSSFSLLLPQALMGVGTVALVHAAVRRVTGAAWGLLAGALVALTPVAALMFRFDNPDALLTLLMTAAAYLVVRAIETPRGRTALGWMVAAGAAIGFAFLTKMLQGLLVLPGLGLAYVIAARHSLRARLLASIAALASVVVSAGWFVALVSLWPADARPYIGGSTNNSLWELALGYNGLGRILGGTGNGGGGGGGMGGTGFGGATGITRMFGSAFGAEVSWLLPAALLLLVGGLVARGRAARTDALRASLVLWGGWLLVTALVLSFMAGTVHPYYAVALVPGIAATVAVGASAVHARGTLPWRVVLAAACSLTACWGLYLLHQGTWMTWLGWVSVLVTAVGAALYVAAPAVEGLRRFAVAGLLVATLGSLLPTTAWTVATVAQPHSGSIPTSGPVSSAMGGPGGGMGGGMGGGVGGQAPQRATGSAPAGSDSTATSAGSTAMTTTSGASLTTLLQDAGTRWSAATIGDQGAAGYILSSGTAVMSVGGWSGSDDNVTLAQFQQYVHDGAIRYFIAGGGMGGGPGGASNGSAAQITAWVQQHYTATTVGGTTVYDLAAATG